jgi:hypothetical protein
MTSHKAAEYITPKKDFPTLSSTWLDSQKQTSGGFSTFRKTDWLNRTKSPINFDQNHFLSPSQFAQIKVSNSPKDEDPSQHYLVDCNFLDQSQHNVQEEEVKVTREIMFNSNSKSHREEKSETEPEEDMEWLEMKRRRRKSTKQLQILKQHYQSGDEWSKEKITYVSDLTGLSES